MEGGVTLQWIAAPQPKPKVSRSRNRRTSTRRSTPKTKSFVKPFDDYKFVGNKLYRVYYNGKQSQELRKPRQCGQKLNFVISTLKDNSEVNNLSEAKRALIFEYFYAISYGSKNYENATFTRQVDHKNGTVAFFISTEDKNEKLNKEEVAVFTLKDGKVTNCNRYNPRAVLKLDRRGKLVGINSKVIRDLKMNTMYSESDKKANLPKQDGIDISGAQYDNHLRDNISLRRLEDTGGYFSTKLTADEAKFLLALRQELAGIDLKNATPEQKSRLRVACRMLASQGMVDGVTYHELYSDASKIDNSKKLNQLLVDLGKFSDKSMVDLIKDSRSQFVAARAEGGTIDVKAKAALVGNMLEILDPTLAKIIGQTSDGDTIMALTENYLSRKGITDGIQDGKLTRTTIATMLRTVDNKYKLAEARAEKIWDGDAVSVRGELNSQFNTEIKDPDLVRADDGTAARNYAEETKARKNLATEAHLLLNADASLYNYELACLTLVQSGALERGKSLKPAVQSPTERAWLFLNEAMPEVQLYAKGVTLGQKFVAVKMLKKTDNDALLLQTLRQLSENGQLSQLGIKDLAQAEQLLKNKGLEAVILNSLLAKKDFNGIVAMLNNPTMREVINMSSSLSKVFAARFKALAKEALNTPQKIDKFLADRVKVDNKKPSLTDKTLALLGGSANAYDVMYLKAALLGNAIGMDKVSLAVFYTKNEAGETVLGGNLVYKWGEDYHVWSNKANVEPDDDREDVLEDLKEIYQAKVSDSEVKLDDINSSNWWRME